MCFVIFPVRAVHSRRLGNRHPTRFHAGATVRPSCLVSSRGKLCALRGAKLSEATAISFSKATRGEGEAKFKKEYRPGAELGNDYANKILLSN